MNYSMEGTQLLLKSILMQTVSMTRTRPKKLVDTHTHTHNLGGAMIAWRSTK